MLWIVGDEIRCYDKEKQKLLEGDSNAIAAYISSHFVELFQKNTVVDTFCSINQVLDEDWLFFHVMRKKRFIVSEKIVRYYGVQKIKAILVDFDLWHYNRELECVRFYAEWEIFTEFQTIHIKEKKDLYREGFHTLIHHPSNSQIFIAETIFSYGLGNYKGWTITNIGWWVASTQSLARKKSLSEAIERLNGSLVVWRDSSVYKDCELDMSFRCLIENHGIYVWQELLCRKGKTLLGGKALIPEELLFYPYEKDRYGYPATSSGMATHVTLREALENALFEIIERDAFLLFRLLKKGGYKIDLSTLNENHKESIDKLEAEWLTLNIISLHFDNPAPVILLMCNKGRRTIIALGVSYSIQEAISKALREISYAKVFFTKELKSNIEEWSVQFHTLSYLRESSYPKVSWILKSPVKTLGWLVTQFPSYNHYRQIAQHYRAIGVGLYSYRYRNIINEIFHRFTVRVLSDSLLPIYFNKEIPRHIKGSRRLEKRKAKMNVKNLNEDVHPLG